MKKFATLAAVFALVISSSIAMADVTIAPESESALIKSTQSRPFDGDLNPGLAVAILGGLALAISLTGDSGSH